MKSINNPLDVLNLEPLKHLDEHLQTLWMQIASGKRQHDHDWDNIDALSISALEDSIKSFQDSESKHHFYLQLVSTLLSAYNKFDDLEGPLEGHYEESGWCEEAKGVIIRYLACVVKYTLFDGPENCAYNMAKVVHQIPSRRNDVLLRVGDSLGVRDSICKFKVDQCYKCAIIPCEGRYIDGLCGYPEQALGESIYNPVYKNRVTSGVPSTQKPPYIVVNNYYSNNISQNNVSLVQQNFHSEQVIMIDETKREEVLRDNLSPKQRKRLNECVQKLKGLGICNEDGRFENEKLRAMLKEYGDKALINGQMVDGALKGLFADAVRNEVGLKTTWLEVQAVFGESGLGTRLFRALKYRDSGKESEKGVFRCLLEIVQDVFPNYLP